MDGEKLFRGWVNPLQFLAIDEPWAASSGPPNSESVLDFLCIPGTRYDLDSLVSRYREISKEEIRLFITPAEERILDKLVWPLRNAKASYMVGNYLGTISLCGMVSEMVAILLFEVSEFRLNEKLMTEDEQTALFGSSFERLGQARRIQILRVYGIIDDDLRNAFDLVRKTRRRYLHLWSQDHERLPKDAVETFQAAVAVVVKAIGQDIVDGKVRLRPALINYLERKGTIGEVE